METKLSINETLFPLNIIYLRDILMQGLSVNETRINNLTASAMGIIGQYFTIPLLCKIIIDKSVAPVFDIIKDGKNYKIVISHESKLECNDLEIARAFIEFFISSHEIVPASTSLESFLERQFEQLRKK